MGIGTSTVKHWALWKYVEEADFGPDPPIHMVFIRGKLKEEEENRRGLQKKTLHL